MSVRDPVLITGAVFILCLICGFIYLGHIETEQRSSFIDSGYNYGYTEHNESVYEYYQLVIDNHNETTMSCSIDYYVATGYIDGYNQWKIESMKKSLGV